MLSMAGFNGLAQNILVNQNHKTPPPWWWWCCRLAAAVEIEEEKNGHPHHDQQGFRWHPVSLEVHVHAQQAG